MADYRTKLQQVTLVGAGVIGGGWAARFLAYGLKVVVSDPGSSAEEKLLKDIQTAAPSLIRQGFNMSDWEERLVFEPDLKTALAEADFVQESAPENEELKTSLLAQIDAYVPAEVIIASSSSGLLPSSIQKDCQYPERI